MLFKSVLVAALWIATFLLFVLDAALKGASVLIALDAFVNVPLVAAFPTVIYSAYAAKEHVITTNGKWIKGFLIPASMLGLSAMAYSFFVPSESIKSPITGYKLIDLPITLVTAFIFVFFIFLLYQRFEPLREG